ncbi:MAG TPA: glycosyltransferase family 4 protein [Candidatus Binataceae bacterium]|nr:glycosyltransferase family 4 protein [Candidatus Binataceae bacterium]
MKRLNLLYAGTLPPHPGGSAIVGYQLVEGLARRGYRIRSIAPAITELLSCGDSFARNHPELRITRFQVPSYDDSPDRGRSDAYHELEGRGLRCVFGEVIRECRPDIVIAGRESMMRHLGDELTRLELPSLVIAHGALMYGLSKGALTPQQENDLRRKLKKSGAIVAVAEHLGAQMRAIGFDRVRVIKNGVDRNRFAPRPKSASLMRQLAIADDALTITFVGNLKPIKRVLDIVAAAPDILRAIPNAIFLIVGDGVMRAQIEDACHSTGVLDRFRFTGWIERDAIPKYMSLADVVVMPSESEGLSLASLEAMASGRTVVASDIPAARELIVDGETGLLFRKGDIAHLAATIVKAADPDLRARIGNAAHASTARFDIEHSIDAYENLLAELIPRE